MTALKKFLFDIDFDSPEKPDETEKKADAEEIEPEKAEPVFKQECLEIAFDAGFDAGKEEGVRETLDGIEKQTAESLAKMAEGLNGLFNKQKEANSAAARDAIAAALAVARKILPGLSEGNALGEVERVVESVLKKITGEPKVAAKVNNHICEQLAKRIGVMRQNSNFHGELTLQADPELSKDDCKIEWSGGGAERDMKSLWREIDAIIERSGLENGLSLPVDAALNTAAKAEIADASQKQASIKNSVKP